MKRLATIMIRPRETMREILDSPGRRWVIPLVLATMISAVAGDFDVAGFRHAMQQKQLVFLGPVIILVGSLVTIGLVYLFSWVASIIGRKVLEGTGNAADVRAAAAWGLVPAIWALLYRIPAIFLVRRETADFGAGSFRISRLMAEGCWAGLLMGTLELITFVWVVVLTSNTVGEAHRFSSWRGFATLLMTWSVPLVVLIAGVLAVVS
ncbi:MAG TPA: YIP1 family protein [Thermoanaerobaculia bacterium]